MKVKINIELWDDTSTEDLENLGLTDKFAKLMYEHAVKQLLEEACDSRTKYEMHVEIEDNTKQ